MNNFNTIGPHTSSFIRKPGNGFFALWDQPTGKLYNLPLYYKVLGENMPALNAVIGRKVRLNPTAKSYVSNGGCMPNLLPRFEGLILSNRPDKDREQCEGLGNGPIEGCRVIAVASFSIDTGPCGYISNVIGNRLITITHPRQCKEYYNCYMGPECPSPWTIAETGTLSTEFNPVDWPGCCELKYVVHPSPALAIAGVTLGHLGGEEQGPGSLKKALDDFNFCPQLRQLSQSTAMPPPTKHDLWGWLDNDVIEKIIQKGVKEAMCHGTSNFLQSLTMRLVCKPFCEAFDSACASVITEAVSLIMIATQSQLIEDWKAVAVPCFKGNVAPWLIVGYINQFHDDPGTVRSRFLQYARIKLMKKPDQMLPM